MTSDNYLPALGPFSYLFTKHWGREQPVVVAGFSPPGFALPPNFTFHSIGDQSDYPVNKWSNALYKFLNEVEDDHFVLMLEDYWLTRPVNVDAVNILYHYMRQFGYVIKMDLCADRLYAHGMKDYGTVSYLDLIVSMPGSPYHMSLYPGIWNKRHLLDTLVPDETPWEIELNGTTRLSHNRNCIVLGTRQQPMKITLGLRGGESGKLILDGMMEDDVTELRSLGMLKHWETE